MRRKSDKDIRKESFGFLLSGYICIIFSLFMVLYPLIPQTPYEEYTEKEVVIVKFERVHGSKGSVSYCIITDNGDKYTLTGEFNSAELTEVLCDGTIATVKCDDNNLFPFIKYVEEMTVNGKRLVTYNNDAPTDWTINIIVFIVSFFAGVGFLIACRKEIIRNRKQQEKRDARIIKKYGKLKK